MNLFIIRGLPGAGKTTLGETVAPGATFSADNFFEGPEGYRWDPTKLPEAHAACLSAVKQALENRVSRVAVANVFQKLEHIRPYLKLAKDAGYTVFVIDLFDQGMTNQELATSCRHGVPAATIARMRAGWER
ncbi:MAG: hypothetical protein EBT03_11920 [Betaproteobacteria bacterium]|nr:hypothetical protein [Betaproteobacteria bacterium]